MRSHRHEHVILPALHIPWHLICYPSEDRNSAQKSKLFINFSQKANALKLHKKLLVKSQNKKTIK